MLATFLPKHVPTKRVYRWHQLVLVASLEVYRVLPPRVLLQQRVHLLDLRKLRSRRACLRGRSYYRLRISSGLRLQRDEQVAYLRRIVHSVEVQQRLAYPRHWPHLHGLQLCSQARCLVTSEDFGRNVVRLELGFAPSSSCLARETRAFKCCFLLSLSPSLSLNARKFEHAIEKLRKPT